jgi:hypothetical protein
MPNVLLLRQPCVISIQKPPQKPSLSICAVPEHPIPRLKLGSHPSFLDKVGLYDPTDVKHAEDASFANSTPTQSKSYSTYCITDIHYSNPPDYPRARVPIPSVQPDLLPDTPPLRVNMETVKQGTTASPYYLVSCLDMAAGRAIIKQQPTHSQHLLQTI